MTRLSLTLLGDFQARLGPRLPLRLRARKTQALLAYLALPTGRPHSRDKLAALLQGEGSPHHARGRLRETLFVLRRTLAPADPPCLDAGHETVALNADSADVDAVAFERLVETGGAMALGQAVDLYRGDLLKGLEFRGALFEDWLMAERERLRELALDALAKLLAYQRSAGLAEPALQTALRLVGLDPLQEAVHRTLMRLLPPSGTGRSGERASEHRAHHARPDGDALLAGGSRSRAHPRLRSLALARVNRPRSSVDIRPVDFSRPPVAGGTMPGGNRDGAFVHKASPLAKGVNDDYRSFDGSADREPRQGRARGH